MTAGDHFHTPELIAAVLAAWRGGATYGQMSRRFSLTKSMVSGIIHRNKQPGEIAARPFRGLSALEPRPGRLPRHHKMTRLAKMAHGARFRTCQWIEQTPTHDDSCKCGAPTGRSRIYCPEHEARAWCAPGSL